MQPHLQEQQESREERGEMGEWPERHLFKEAYFLLLSSCLWAGLGWRETTGEHGEERCYHWLYQSKANLRALTVGDSDTKSFKVVNSQATSWVCGHVSCGMPVYSVAKSSPTLCNPMDCSTPGFSVPHRFPEFAQKLHWVSDAIRPSRPLPFCLHFSPVSGSFLVSWLFISGGQKWPVYQQIISYLQVKYPHGPTHSLNP